MAIITNTIGKLEILTAEGIGAPHCFTTRLGGVSQGRLSSLNLSIYRDDEEENVVKNYEILANTLNFDLKNLVLTNQVHSDVVRTVTKADCLGPHYHRQPECDALITGDPGTALMVFTADCTPILLWDAKTGAVGAAHAGWRGTAADIAGKTVRAMQAQLGCDPKNIHAAIGPNIGACCFETDREVPDAMRSAFGAEAEVFIRPVGEKFYLDLKKMNALALKNAGVTNIDICQDCTVCQPGRFWSHRVHGPGRGSQGAIIVCGEGTL